MELLKREYVMVDLTAMRRGVDVGEKGFDKSKVILFEKRPIRSGSQTLTFTVDKAPKFAGVDPYNYLIDRNADDNVAPAD